jgi:hypothetical protein
MLAQKLADSLGRPVTIGGQLDLKLGLSPSITIDHITIGNAPWASRPVMVEMRRFEAALELTPLLRREVSISRLKVAGVSAWLETDVQGRGNWELGTTGAGPGQLPWFYQVEAERVRVLYHDGVTGATHQADIERATALAERRDGPVTLLVVGKIDSEKIDIGGSFGPLTALIERRGDALRLDLTGNAYGVRMAVKGTIIEPLAPQGIALALTASGSDTKQLARLLVRPMPDLGAWCLSGRLDDRAGRLALRGINGAVGSREASLLTVKGDIDDLLAAGGTSRGVKLDLALETAELAKLGEALAVVLPPLGPFEGTARLEETTGRYVLNEIDLAGGSRERIAVVARGSVGDLAAQGGPATMLFDLVLEGQATDALSRIIGVPVPAMGAYRASGCVHSAGKIVALENMTLKVGSSDLTGDLRLDLAGDRPRAEGRLASNRLNLSEWRSAAVAAPPRRSRVFDATPIPLDWTKLADLAVRYEAKEVAFDEFTASDIFLDFELKGGQFTLRPSAAQLFGGRVNLDGAIDARAAMPQMRAKLIARGMEASRVSRAMGAVERVEGKLDVTADLSGRGETVRNLIGSLNGRAAATLTNGRVANRQIEWIAADLMRVLLPGTAELETPISCAVSQFDLKNGLATAQALLLDTRRVTVTGTGTINLATEALALRLDPKPKEPSLLSLAHPMLIGGTLSEPTVRPDPTGIAKGIGGAALGLAMGPVGLLIPFLSAGTGDANPCAKLLSSGRR